MCFLLHTNDINHAITSKAKLYADDSILHINTRNQNGHLNLRNDVDTISLWAYKLLMALCINKCVVLSARVKHHSSFHDYIRLASHFPPFFVGS